MDLEVLICRESTSERNLACTIMLFLMPSAHVKCLHETRRFVKLTVSAQKHCLIIYLVLVLADTELTRFIRFSRLLRVKDKMQRILTF